MRTKKEKGIKDEWILRKDNKDMDKEKDVLKLETLEHFLLDCDAYESDRALLWKQMKWTGLSRKMKMRKMAGNLRKNESPDELLSFIKITYSRRYKALYKRSVRNEWWIGRC